MKKITKKNLNEAINKFFKANVTIFVLFLLIFLAGANIISKSNICDGQTCYTPKIVEEDYTMSDIQQNENIGTKYPSVTEAHLPKALIPSFMRSGKGLSRYNQYILFAGGVANPVDSGSPFFGRNQMGVIDDYLYFNDSTDAYEYGLIFEDGLKSNLQNAKLMDIINEPITMLGRDIYILDAKIDPLNNKIYMKLVDAVFVDLLAEGQKKIYKIDDSVYEVEVLGIEYQTNRVKFKVNGKDYKILEPGQMQILPDNMILGVAEVLGKKEAIGIVQFYLAETLYQFSDVYNDMVYSNDVRTQRHPLSNAKIGVVGSFNGNEFTLDQLKFRLNSKSLLGDIYVPAHKTLRQSITEPDAMFPGNWDIEYNGFGGGQISSKEKIPIQFNPTGSGFNLIFSNIQGVRYRIPLLSGSGQFVYGDGQKALHFIESSGPTVYDIDRNDMFVLTSQNNDRGTTNIISYDNIDTANKKIYFKDWALGTKEVVYQSGVGEGQGSLTASGISYPFYISSEEGNPITVDLNGDGTIAGDEANVVVQGGGRIDLGSSEIIVGTTVSMRLIVPVNLLEDKTSSEVVQINFVQSEHTVNINIPNQDVMTMVGSQDKDTYQGQTQYGALFQLNKRVTTSELFVDFPIKQVLGSVSIKVKNRMMR